MSYLAERVQHLDTLRDNYRKEVNKFKKEILSLAKTDRPEALRQISYKPLQRHMSGGFKCVRMLMYKIDPNINSFEYRRGQCNS